MASGTNFESILCEGNDAEIIYYDDKPAAQIQQPKPARKPEPVCPSLKSCVGRSRAGR